MKTKLISLEEARWKLAKLWFIACAVVFAILVGQSIGSVYEGRLQAAWSWALPNFIPTLALMVSVFAADALKDYKADNAPQVRDPFFKLSFWLSAFYLLVLSITVLAQPFFLTASSNSRASPVELLEISNLWLAPLQGLVVAALGVLFFLKEERSKPSRKK